MIGRRPKVGGSNLRVTWNIKAGRCRTARGYLALLRAFRRILRRHDRPAVIALNECGGNWRAVKRIAKNHGYRIITGRGAEGASSALLIRNDVPVTDSGLIQVNAPWVGPKGGKHPGRTFPWATVRIAGMSRNEVAVHLPWSLERNAWSFNTCLDTLVAFESNSSLPVEFLGDWNVRVGSVAMHRFAQRFDGHVVRTGDPLIYAVVSGFLKARNVIGRAKTHEGSDHPYAVLRDTA